MLDTYTSLGSIYVIHVNTMSSGIPYADSFYPAIHFCLTKVKADESRLIVYASIHYKKTVWGLVKSKILDLKKY